MRNLRSGTRIGLAALLLAAFLPAYVPTATAAECQVFVVTCVLEGGEGCQGATSWNSAGLGYWQIEDIRDPPVDALFYEAAWSGSGTKDGSCAWWNMACDITVGADTITVYVIQGDTIVIGEYKGLPVLGDSGRCGTTSANACGLVGSLLIEICAYASGLDISG